jgi:Amt family ammonium transporter
VHGVGGFMGLLLTAPLSVYLGGVAPLDDGQTVGGQFLVQLTGAVATLAWCAVATFVLLKLIGIVTPLRAEEDDERQGLDLTEHEERGYSF